MRTPYEEIYRRFERKVKKNKSYFFYRITDINLTDEEKENKIIEIINDRNLGLMEDAIDYIQSKIVRNQNVDLYDKDDENAEFNFELKPIEIRLIADRMVICLWEEEAVELMQKQKYLGNDINVFSPANERKTFLDFLTTIQDKFDKDLNTYNLFDRNTGDFLSPY